MGTHLLHNLFLIGTVFSSLGDPGSIPDMGRVGSHPSALASHPSALASPYCTRGGPSPARVPELRVTPAARHVAPAKPRGALREQREEMGTSAEISWFEK